MESHRWAYCREPGISTRPDRWMRMCQGKSDQTLDSRGSRVKGQGQSTLDSRLLTLDPFLDVIYTAP